MYVSADWEGGIIIVSSRMVYGTSKRGLGSDKPCASRQYKLRILTDVNEMEFVLKSTASHA